MTVVALAVLGGAAAFVQSAILPMAANDPLATPVLPLALIAAWAAIRDPRETWPAALAGATVLGVLSEQRVGAFLLALLVPVAIAIGLRRLEESRERGRLGRAPLAALTGALGTAAYLALLLALAGRLDALTSASHALAAAALWTALVAAVLAVGVRPPRQRVAGLFE